MILFMSGETEAQHACEQLISKTQWLSWGRGWLQAPHCSGCSLLLLSSCQLLLWKRIPQRPSRRCPSGGACRGGDWGVCVLECSCWLSKPSGPLGFCSISWL